MFSTLPQLHNGDADMFFKNRSLFNELQLFVNVCVRFVISDCL